MIDIIGLPGWISAGVVGILAQGLVEAQVVANMSYATFRPAVAFVTFEAQAITNTPHATFAAKSPAAAFTPAVPSATFESEDE